MTGYPANVSGTKMYIARLILKDINKGIICINHIAAAGMYHTFWLTRAAGRVQYKKGIFSIHFLRREIVQSQGFHFFNFVIPPYVAAFDHAYRSVGARINNYFFHKPDTDQSVINYTFKRYIFSASESAVAGYYIFCLRIY